ncbi:hypothetical protein M9458_053614, partial [Cirrhinus mrigala]
FAGRWTPEAALAGSMGDLRIIVWIAPLGQSPRRSGSLACNCLPALAVKRSSQRCRPCRLCPARYGPTALFQAMILTCTRASLFGVTVQHLSQRSWPVHTQKMELRVLVEGPRLLLPVGEGAPCWPQIAPLPFGGVELATSRGRIQGFGAFLRLLGHMAAVAAVWPLDRLALATRPGPEMGMALRVGVPLSVAPFSALLTLCVPTGSSALRP